MSSKHVICKSKTLDVPIIITSTIQGVGGGGGGGGLNDSSATTPTSPPLSTNNHSTHPIYIENNSPIVAAAVKYTLDKGYSLDSKFLSPPPSIDLIPTSIFMAAAANSASDEK